MKLNFETVEKANVLVVDDSPDSLCLISGLLKDDYKVEEAEDGETALRIVHSGHLPDLILLDILMPNMDGYEVCRRLKINPATRGIPVIFLTAMSDVKDEQKGLFGNSRGTKNFENQVVAL